MVGTPHLARIRVLLARASTNWFEAAVTRIVWGCFLLFVFAFVWVNSREDRFPKQVCENPRSRYPTNNEPHLRRERSLHEDSDK